MEEKKEMKIVKSNNLGTFYKHVNKNSVHKSGIGPLKNADGNLVLDIIEKAELLNAYFVSICTIDNGLRPPLPYSFSTLTSDKISTVVFRAEPVQRIMKKLKNKTSFGPDCLPTILYKQLASQLAYPLAAIFNIFVLSGTVPEI